MSVGQKVTRLEIAEAVRPAFDKGSATRDEIVAVATTTSRPAVVEVLKGLPEGRYQRLNELWEDLADVPLGA